MLAVRRDSSSVLAAETRRFLVDKREMMELEACVRASTSLACITRQMKSKHDGGHAGAEEDDLTCVSAALIF